VVQIEEIGCIGCQSTALVLTFIVCWWM